LHQGLPTERRTVKERQHEPPVKREVHQQENAESVEEGNKRRLARLIQELANIAHQRDAAISALQLERDQFQARISILEHKASQAASRAQTVPAQDNANIATQTDAVLRSTADCTSQTMKAASSAASTQTAVSTTVTRGTQTISEMSTQTDNDARLDVPLQQMPLSNARLRQYELPVYAAPDPRPIESAGRPTWSAMTRGSVVWVSDRDSV
jgi:hypothetical protein